MYNTQKDIIDELSREMFVEFLKQGIRATYPKSLADIYCTQVDDAKMMAKPLRHAQDKLKR